MRHDPAIASIVIMLSELKLQGIAQAVEKLTEQSAPAFDAAQPILFADFLDGRQHLIGFVRGMCSLIVTSDALIDRQPHIGIEVSAQPVLAFEVFEPRLQHDFMERFCSRLPHTYPEYLNEFIQSI